MSTIFSILLLAGNSKANEEIDFSMGKYKYFGGSSFIEMTNKDVSGKRIFIDDEYLLGKENQHLTNWLSSNLTDQDKSAQNLVDNSADPQTEESRLRSAHRYLGYGTAVLAGITAASYSSGGIHRVAGYATAGLSVLTTAIGFYEYGEYIDLNDGFTGYNAHMILETVATAGFLAAAALQSDNSHAAIGGISTALLILPIFVVHW